MTPSPIRGRTLVVRWTIGDVSDFGFEALRLSVLGASRVFGGAATYVVCVNSIRVETAAARVGRLPVNVRWLGISSQDVPAFIRARLDAGFAEGVGWKFAPLRIDEDAFELALDNDCILWQMPRSVRLWLRSGTRPLIAGDVRACFGQFAPVCGVRPQNSGVRGLPPHWPFEEKLRSVLHAASRPLTSETDEQGLQVAAVNRCGPAIVVSTDEVSICSPFHPHQPYLGRCGAHFVGLNAKTIEWSYYDRPALDVLHAHWRGLRDVVRRRIEDPRLQLSEPTAARET